MHDLPVCPRLIDQGMTDPERRTIAIAREVVTHLTVGREVLIELDHHAIGPGGTYDAIHHRLDHPLGLVEALEGVRDLHEGLVPRADGRTRHVLGQCRGIEGLGSRGRVLLRDPDLHHGWADIQDVPVQKRLGTRPHVSGDTADWKRQAGLDSDRGAFGRDPDFQDAPVAAREVQLDFTAGFEGAEPEGLLIHGNLLVAGAIRDLEVNEHGRSLWPSCREAATDR